MQIQKKQLVMGHPVKAHLKELFDKLNRPEPILFIGGDIEKTKKWVLGPKHNDLLTFSGLVHGFEHNVVAVSYTHLTLPTTPYV